MEETKPCSHVVSYTIGDNIDCLLSCSSLHILEIFTCKLWITRRVIFVLCTEYQRLQDLVDIEEVRVT